VAYVPCPVVRLGAAARLAELKDAWNAMRDRLLRGTAPLVAVMNHYGPGGGGDPATNCYERAAQAERDAADWLLAKDAAWLVRYEEARRVLENLDCSAPALDVDAQIGRVMAAIEALGWWLDPVDQELGTLEAHWRQLADGCPVPPPPAPPPPEDEGEGP
jgi:hypothetical protein